MDIKYSTDTKIEDNSRMFKLQKAHFDQEINTAVSSIFTLQWSRGVNRTPEIHLQAVTVIFITFIFIVLFLQKAEAQLAYELQAAKIKQKIRNEEIQIEIVERRKQIEVESKEVQRKERELNATVRLPAEAESYRVQTIAEGKR